MKFILVMIWMTNAHPITLQLGPFETEKLCVDAAAMIWNKWKKHVSGDFACIPTAYPEEEK